mmetsp:Transcript_28479/g.38511  ORF Transcript_28479/g.38511 Transcript_28479/m.38511 type:complete len:108 (-) Transcript_28479:79-402(-)
MSVAAVTLLEATSSSAIRTIAEFSSQGLATTAWSFACLEIRDIPLLDSIAASALGMRTEFVGQELINLSCAFSALLYADGPLRDALSAQASRTISECGLLFSQVVDR